MAGSVNKVILVGNVGKDPEIRTAGSSMVANLSIATSESWKDKRSGERVEKTEWHRIVVWGDALCNVIEQYVRKGSKLYLEGALQTRKWTDQSGVEKYSTEVVLNGFGAKLVLLGDRGGGRGEDGVRDGGASAGSSRSSNRPQQQQRDRELDDEIPF
jgi:single-strand DNA-binding protein